MMIYILCSAVEENPRSSLPDKNLGFHST